MLQNEALMPIFVSYIKSVWSSTTQTQHKHSCSLKVMLTSFFFSLVSSYFLAITSASTSSIFHFGSHLHFSTGGDPRTLTVPGRVGCSNPNNGRNQFIILPSYHKETLLQEAESWNSYKTRYFCEVLFVIQITNSVSGEIQVGALDKYLLQQDAFLRWELSKDNIFLRAGERKDKPRAGDFFIFSFLSFISFLMSNKNPP